MAYSTGIATTATEILDAVKAFAESNGWTTDYYGADGSYKRLHIHKGSIFANFSGNYSPSTCKFGACLSSGFAGSGVAWNAQTAPLSGIVTSEGPVQTLPVTYHLFAQTSPDFLGICMEYSNGYAFHVIIGSATKIGTYSGDAQFIGAYNPLYVNAAQTTVGNSYGSINGIQFFDGTSFVTPSYYSGGLQAGVDTRTNIAPFHQIHFGKTVSTYYQPWGVIPHVRVLGRNYQQAEEITYGSDVWKVFHANSPGSLFQHAYKK